MRHKKEFDRERKFQMMGWGIAGLFLTLLVVGYLLMVGYKPAKANIVFLGDSIFAEGGETGYIAEKLAATLRKTVFNGCLGGSSAAWSGTEYDFLSLNSLSKGIVTGDFSQQKSTHIKTPATEYFDALIENLTQIDFDQVDTLILHYGLNDYHMGSPVFGEGEKDPHSFMGAMDYAIDSIKGRYPNIRIVLVTPSYAWYPEQGGTCENMDYGGGFLEEYVDALVTYGREKGIQVIDQYHGLFTDTEPGDWQKYTVDGVHLNETGKKLAAKQLADYFIEHKE